MGGSVVLLVMGVIVVALVAVPGVVVLLRIARASSADESCVPREGTVVVLGDWELVSAAYGPDRVRELLAQLRSAGLDLDTRASFPAHGVEVVASDALAALSGRLREKYAWRPDEIALLTDVAVTGAIRVVPVSRRRKSPHRRT